MGIAMVLSAGNAFADRLHDLFAEYFEWQKREFPAFAVSKGDYRNADQLGDASLAAIERRQGEQQDFLKRLQAIPRDTLSSEDQLNWDLFEWELRKDVEGYPFRVFLAPVGGLSGPQQDIPQLHEQVNFNNLRDYENYLSRLQQVPKRVDDVIERLKLGVQEKRTPPRITLAGVPEQFATLLGGGLNALAEPFEDWPETVSAEQRQTLRARFDDELLPAIRKACEKLGAYLEAEYIPACRESIAAVDWPDGEAYYAHQLRIMTTTDLSPREIHELGLSEVKRIRAEMMAVIARSDFLEHVPEARELDDEGRFQRFLRYLREDPRFYFDRPEDLLSSYRALCKRIDGHLPSLFGLLPRLPYGVREIPAVTAPQQTSAYYQPGSLANAQAGNFYVNTYGLDQRPKYEMISLACHEAVPGHHQQIAIAQELEDVPEFRKNMWITSYGEGWALYAERLGIEMELYDDPYDDFGRLLFEMWRACRLVVDPGMHALGWSRQQAIDYMLENTALTELNIRNEIDRYIGWPGQACGYKLGELKIRELRKRAEETLGGDFDLRAFHDEVLKAGPLPLDVLDKRVEAWLHH